MDLLNYKDLSVSEKIILVEEIWDSIAEDNIRLTKEHKDLLDDRLNSYEKNQSALHGSKLKRM
jgi:putative addiction module component (TIGR02574 family)